MRFVTRVAFAVCLFSPIASAHAASILLAPGGSGLNVQARLVGLGHTVTVGDPTTWGPSFNYAPYDVVAFEYSSANPASIGHLVAAVDASEVGVVFFRGYGAENTAIALGLITGGSLGFQTPTFLNLINNSHPVTAGLSLGGLHLGYTYMSLADLPAAASTTTLATGPGGAALVVHNTRHAVITPFYAHPTNYASESAAGLDITQRSIVWAASGQSAPTPTSSTTWGRIKAIYR